jgi:hypothetical protein
MKTTFETTDIGLAAWILLTQNMRLLSVARIPDPNRNIANLVFSDPESIGYALEAEYFAGDGVVQPLAFFNQIRRLKRQVHSACAGSVMR